MKKIFIVFALCVAFLLTLSAAATNVRGDVDQNGTRTFYDALQILQYVVNNRPLTGSDVNRDGKTNLLDVLRIFRMIASDDGEPEGIDGMTLLEFVSNNHSPKVAGDVAMQNMIRISSDEMKGTHDAQYVFANGKAYVVYEANNEMSGDPGTYEKEYSALAIVNLDTFTVESIKKFAYGEQEFANVTLPTGSAFVPRVIHKDENTLRFYFSNIVKNVSAYIYYVDYDLATETFYDSAYRLKIMTPEGEVDFTAEVYAELFRASGHSCVDIYYGQYLFDIFDIGDTKYIALNNYNGGQNSLAKFNDTYDCVEIIGNIGGVDDIMKTTESGIIQLKDGTWMSILRNESGDKNYRFSYSKDGSLWSYPAVEDFMTNGTTSKPVLARFGDYYFMGWNELSRGVFHFAYSLDAKNWTTLYSFYAPTTFQYPEFDIHDGQMYFSVTTGSKEEIWFGKLPIYEKDGNLYIDEQTDGVEAAFDDLSGFTLVCDSVQTNDSGTSFSIYAKRDADGVYLYGESDGKMIDDKLFFMLDTVGTATTLSATASPDNIMFRFYGAVQVQAVYAEGKRGYKSLALYEDVEFFKHEDGNGTKVGIFMPYAAIKAMAPYATAAAADSDLYIAVYGADGSSNKEYVPVLAGQNVKWKNPSTYAIFTAAGEIKAR